MNAKSLEKKRKKKTAGERRAKQKEREGEKRRKKGTSGKVGQKENENKNGSKTMAKSIDALASYSLLSTLLPAATCKNCCENNTEARKLSAPFVTR